MRRSTAAAIGTLTGAALIVGVRLSVSAPVVPSAAPPAVDLANSGQDADPEPGATSSKKPSKKPAGNNEEEADASGEAGGSGLKNGIFKGSAAKNPYGTIQVSIKISGGKITAADATYPVKDNSATINPPAIASLKQSTLQAQSADIDAVSGATFTSESYVKSLQAAIDQATA